MLRQVSRGPAAGANCRTAAAESYRRCLTTRLSVRWDVRRELRVSGPRDGAVETVEWAADARAVVTPMWPGRDDPDFGSFLVPLVRELRVRSATNRSDSTRRRPFRTFFTADFRLSKFCARLDYVASSRTWPVITAFSGVLLSPPAT